jgi:hypothetical protein
LQEKLAELGCGEVFGGVPEKISSLLGIEVGPMQVYRSCQNMAGQLSETDLSTPSAPLKKIGDDPGEELYGMVDGSMLFTDDGWQETKVGRVFKAQMVGGEPFKWKMEGTQYVAKRGHYLKFTEQFENLLPPGSACKKIFVTDGAAWIGQWIKEKYGGAVHILDFFHVCEKLSGAVPNNKGWLELQKTDLLGGRVGAVIERVKLLPKSDCVEKLGTYLENHRENMDYGEYRKQGWMIGSGPIESAHRTVLQVRMKRSGIRWGNPGCDNMIKLRVVYKNKQRNLIAGALKKAA